MSNDLIRSYEIHTKCLGCIHKKACPYAFSIKAENALQFIERNLKSKHPQGIKRVEATKKDGWEGTPMPGCFAIRCWFSYKNKYTNEEKVEIDTWLYDAYAEKFDSSANQTTAESIDESIPNSLGALDLVDLQRNHKEDYDSIKNSEEMKNIIDDFLDQIGRYSQTKEYDKYGLSKLSADLTTVSKDLQKVIDDIADKYKKINEDLEPLNEYHNSSYRFSSLQRDYRNDQKKSDIYYYIEECRPNGVRHAIEGKYGFKKPYNTLDQAKEAAKELSLKSADHLTYAVCNSEDSHLAYYADGEQIKK